MASVQKDSDRLTVLAALSEPMRRRAYALVASSPGGVSRDGAAEALGVSRSVAAFHLDKLSEVGLVVVDYRRPEGRTGPGAGRPAKWYKRAPGEIAVSVPERRYDFAASLLARALTAVAETSRPIREVLREVATARGHEIGAGLPKEVSVEARAERLLEVLAELGYEPSMAGRRITLSNCPFHVLAEEHRELVCGMNEALLGGIAEGAGLARGAARLDPAPGCCCVVVDT
ncbi:MAG: helix-turn-helix transcriptional regulator [Acidimicrobiales bacterium]